MLSSDTYEYYTPLDTKVSFNWANHHGITDYQIQIDTSINFNSNLLFTIHSNAPSLESRSSKTSISDLKYNTKYYWRVRGWHDFDTTSWSKILAFKTIDKVEVRSIFSPYEDTTSIAPNFIWYYEDGGTQYEIQIDTDSVFNSEDLIIERITPRRHEYSGVYNFIASFGKKYYWRVRASNNKYTSNWSTTSVYYSPTFPLMAKEHEESSWLEKTVKWLKIDGVEKYIYEVDKSPDFNSFDKLIGETNYDTTETTLNLEEFNKTYFFRVKAVNGNDHSQWSEGIKITTDKKIEIISPRKEAYNVSRDKVKLTWRDKNGNIPSFQIEYDTTNLFNSNIRFRITLPNTKNWWDEQTLTVLNMRDNVVYFWRIRAVNQKGYSNWSESHFSTGDRFIEPSMPQLLGPDDEKENVPSEVKLSWTLVNAQRYQYQVDTDSTFSDPITGITGESYVNIDNLKKGEVYYWRVRAISKGFYADWTSWRIFRTEVPTGIFNHNLKESNNFTNPVSTTFSIKRENQAFTSFSVVMLNALGKKVLSKENISSSASFDISNFENGIYVLTIFENGKLIASKKILKR